MVKVNFVCEIRVVGVPQTQSNNSELVTSHKIPPGQY